MGSTQQQHLQPFLRQCRPILKSAMRLIQKDCCSCHEHPETKAILTPFLSRPCTMSTGPLPTFAVWRLQILAELDPPLRAFVAQHAQSILRELYDVHALETDLHRIQIRFRQHLQRLWNQVYTGERSKEDVLENIAQLHENWTTTSHHHEQNV